MLDPCGTGAFWGFAGCGTVRAESGSSHGCKVGGLLLPGALPNRAYRLCSDSEHLSVIIGTCKFSPITAVQCRAKGRSLPRVSSLFRPHPSEPRGRIVMVETPGTAPGSTTIIPRSVYHHSQGASPSGTVEHKERKGGLQERRTGALPCFLPPA